MRRRRWVVVVSLLAALGTFSLDGGRAEGAETGKNGGKALSGSLKERAERVQERRKARITQSQREAVAARAKAAREKAAQQTLSPDAAIDGKGKAQ